MEYIIILTGIFTCLINDFILATPISSSIPRLPLSLRRQTIPARRYYLPRHIKDSDEVIAEVSQARNDGYIPKQSLSIRNSAGLVTTTLPPPKASQEKNFGPPQLLDLYNRLGKILGLQDTSVESLHSNEIKKDVIDPRFYSTDNKLYNRSPNYHTDSIYNQIQVETPPEEEAPKFSFPKPKSILSHSFPHVKRRVLRGPSSIIRTEDVSPTPADHQEWRISRNPRINKRRENVVPRSKAPVDNDKYGGLLRNRLLSLLRHSRINTNNEGHSGQEVSKEGYEIRQEDTFLPKEATRTFERSANLRKTFARPSNLPQSSDDFDHLLELKPIDENVFSRLILPRQQGGNLVIRPRESIRLVTTTTTVTPTTTTTTTTQPTTTTTISTTTIRQRKIKRRRKISKSTEQPTVEFSIDELKQLLFATAGQGFDRSELIKAAYFPYLPQQQTIPIPPALPLRPHPYAQGRQSYTQPYGDYFYDGLPPPSLSREPKPAPFKAYSKSAKEGLADISHDYGSISNQLSELSAILTPAPPEYEEYYDDYSFFPISPKKYNEKVKEAERNRPPDPFVTADGKKADEIAGNLLSRLGIGGLASNKASPNGNLPFGEVNENHLSPYKVFNTFQSIIETIFSKGPTKEVGPQLKDIPRPAPFSVNNFGFRRK